MQPTYLAGPLARCQSSLSSGQKDAARVAGAREHAPEHLLSACLTPASPEMPRDPLEPSGSPSLPLELIHFPRSHPLPEPESTAMHHSLFPCPTLLPRLPDVSLRSAMKCSISKMKGASPDARKCHHRACLPPMASGSPSSIPLLFVLPQAS